MSRRIVHRLIVASLLALTALYAPLSNAAQIAVSITLAPPGLPVYDQPPMPAVGYIWTPGYWAYGDDGYFWVPGTWIEPPEVGLLWTPGYWAWSDGIYIWNAGYWGPEIGFYGGVDYGFGYSGHGYAGGYWRGGEFYYNRTVNNVSNLQVRNVYTQTVVNNVTVNKVSYVGGPGGLTAAPTAHEQEIAHGRHTPPTGQQTQQRVAASSRHDLLASVNNGKPQVAATSRPGDFSGRAVPAREAGKVPTAATREPASRAAGVTTQQRQPQRSEEAAPVHARDLPRMEPPAKAPASARPEEQAVAKQQADLQARHVQERAALAKQQDSEHASFAQQGSSRSSQAFQDMESRHQQQTQQLQQRQAAERSKAQKPETQQRNAGGESRKSDNHS